MCLAQNGEASLKTRQSDSESMPHPPPASPPYPTDISKIGSCIKLSFRYQI